MSENGAVTHEAVEAYAQSVVGYTTGYFVAMMIHLGERLGLYKTLAEVGG